MPPHIAILSRRVRGGSSGGGGGGGGGSASALDSPSTTVYSPEAIPNHLLCTLPRTFLDTRYDQGGTALSWSADDLLTDAGNAASNHTTLQNAINAANTRNGHSRIRLPDGWVSEGVARPGVKTMGNWWGYIQRASRGTEGSRCTSGQMSGAPILRTTVANRAAVETAVGAKYWRFDDIKFETTASETQTILNIGPTDTNGDNAGSSVTDLPEYIYLSRCWVQGKNNSTGDVVNGVTLNAQACAFIDGIVDQIWRSGVESHCIVSFTAKGPMKIVNNKLECPAIRILFGGANPHITGFVAEDLEIRRNHFTLRDAWNPYGGSWDSIARPIKNALEFKMGGYVLVEGNVLEKCPLGGQNGETYVVKSMAGEAGLNASWYKTHNICFRYNKSRECGNWLYITGVQMPHLETLGGTDRIVFYDELVYDYADGRYTNTDSHHLIFPGDATNVQFEHVTAIPRSASITTYRPRSTMWTPDTAAGAMAGLKIRNSIWHAGRYEANRWSYTNVGTDGETELARVTGSNYQLANSIMIDGPSGVWASGEMSLVANIAAMNFTGDDPSAGLDSDSPAKNAATDGTDIGCNYTKVNLATSGVV
jgi:hypothetical protein